MMMMTTLWRSKGVPVGELSCKEMLWFYIEKGSSIVLYSLLVYDALSVVSLNGYFYSVS